MISYSHGARKALGRLYRPYNKLTVFVEDTRHVHVHTNIVNLALSGLGQVHTVIALGDRPSVIAAAQNDSDPKNFYFVDGDLNLINSAERSPKKNLYILKCYSLENLALMGADICDILRDYCPYDSKAVIIGRMDLTSWWSEVERLFAKLFVYYAISHFANVGIPTVNYSVMQLVDPQNRDSIDPAAVRARLRSVLSAIVASIGRSAFLSEVRRIRAHLKVKRISPLRYIAGKQYLLPLFHKRCEIKGRFVGSQEVLLNRISRDCDFSADPKFKVVLRKAFREAV
jgi:hypothetical protein